MKFFLKNSILILRILVAVILIQTLRYKFTAHPDSVYIFSKIGMEPYGRIGIGVFELIAAILLLIPKTIWQGALLTLLMMSGAIFFHATSLGIEINNDKGTLFFMAVGTFLLSCLILFSERKKIPFIGKKFQ